MSDLIVTTPRRLAADLPADTAQVLILGPSYWGKGDTLDAAKRSFRGAGGSLSRGYIVYAFPKGLTSLYVNGMGGVAWEWEDGADPIKPLAKLGVRGPGVNF